MPYGRKTGRPMWSTMREWCSPARFATPIPLVRYPELKERMLGAIKVGDRRWTLKLKSGVEVMLPDDNVDEALTSLNKLEQEHGVLERDIAAVDLRLLDRVTVRLHETASVSPGDAAAPQELPTASTKGTKAKGKT